MKDLGEFFNVDFDTLKFVGVFLFLSIGASLMKPEFFNVRFQIQILAHHWNIRFLYSI